MSVKSQQTNMRRLSELLSQNLGYIFGDRESGPNGAKKEFLSKGRTFLSALGKDLKFTEMKVTVNPAGIAVSGEVTLMGMWSEGNGLYIQLTGPVLMGNCVLYRSIEHMKDYRGGNNRFLTTDFLRCTDYEKLVYTFACMNKKVLEGRFYGNVA